MKTRNGFVSNSSSSSFIVMHYSELNSIEEVDKLLPDCIESFRCSKGWREEDAIEIFTRKQVAEFILKDLKKISLEELKIFHVNGGYLESDWEYPPNKGFSWEDFYSNTSFSNTDITENDREYTAKNWSFYYLVCGNEGGYLGNFMEAQIAPMISTKIYSHH